MAESGISALPTLQFKGAEHPLRSKISRRRIVGLVQLFDFSVAFLVAMLCFDQLNTTDSNRFPLALLIGLQFATITIFVNQPLQLYKINTIRSKRLTTSRSFAAGLLSSGIFLVPAFLAANHHIEYVTLALAVVAASGILACSRWVAADVVGHLIKMGAADLRICIIGYDTGSIAILRAFLERHCRSRVVQVFDISERLDGHAGSWLQYALDLFTAHPADAVVLIPSDLPASVGRMVHGLPYRSYLAPSLATLDELAACVPNPDGASELEALGFVRISDRPLSGWRWLAKDLQDRLIALCLLVVLMPVLVIVAATIKLSSSGPILFRQRRRGHGGTSFEIYKFRTMRVDPNASASGLLQLTTRNDPRVFAVGRILRSTSIDEIPQLVNVLKGDMWIVGPRPHSPLARVGDKIYAEAVDNYLTRYRIKPGITGWAQVCGWRGPTETVEQLQARVDHDLYYIDHWSPLFDAWILVKTLYCGAMHVNAF